MTIDWQRVLPVLASILIIIGVAVARQYWSALAPIVATMPINVPLALWIVYSAEGGDPAKTQAFTQDLLINIFPSLVFLLIAWLAARAGWMLVPLIVAGYIGWGVSLGVILVIRRMLGV